MRTLLIGENSRAVARRVTINGMVESRVSANLTSLGAVDFGIIVDGAVIIVENCLRLLAQAQHKKGGQLTTSERLQTIVSGAREVIGPSLFGTGIIAVVYLPVLTLTGVEGKMTGAGAEGRRPLATVVIGGIISSTVLTLLVLYVLFRREARSV